MAPTPPLASRTGRDAALAYAQRGWHVFPLHSIVNRACSCHRNCDHPAKHPITRGGLNDATTNPRDIRAWFDRWPWANVAIATGARSNLVVVDIDTPKGGQRSIDTNPSMGSLPETLTALTGGGGLHLLYTHPGGQVRNTAGHLPGVDTALVGVDLRGDGGYIVAPPSHHASGQFYSWRDPTVALAPTPAWLRPAVPPPHTAVRAARSGPAAGDSRYGLAALSRELDHLEHAVPGERNAALNRSAFALGTLVAGGELAASRVHSDLLAAAVALGLREPEAEATIASGLEAGGREPRSRPRSTATSAPAPTRPTPSAATPEATPDSQPPRPMGGDSDGIGASLDDRKEPDMAEPQDGQEIPRTSHPRLEANPFTLGLDWHSDRSGSRVDLGGGYQARVDSIGEDADRDLYRWAIVRPPAGNRDTPLVVADGTMPSAEAARQAAETVLWSVWGAPDTATAAQYLAAHTEFTARVVVDGPLAANRAAGDDYLASHPQFAERVAAHGAELARQYGLGSPLEPGGPATEAVHLTDAEVVANLSRLGFPEGGFELRRFDDHGNQVPPDGTWPRSVGRADTAPARTYTTTDDEEEHHIDNYNRTARSAADRGIPDDGGGEDPLDVDPDRRHLPGPGQGSPAALAQTAYPLRLSVVPPHAPRNQTPGPQAPASPPQSRHR